MILEGKGRVISTDLAFKVIIELAGLFEVPVPEVKFTCQYTSRGWYHPPNCGCGCDQFRYGSIRLGRKGAMTEVVLHEFAHHLLRHKLYDWKTVTSHGPDWRRYLGQVAAKACEELGWTS